LRRIPPYRAGAKGKEAMMIRPFLVAALSMLAAAADAQPPAQSPAQPPAPPPAPSGLEAQVFALLNEARTNPAGYAATLRAYRSHFEGNVVHLPGSDVGVRTREGVAAVDEAIAFLGRQTPLPPFRHAPDLVESARELAAEQALNGGTGHAGATVPDAKVRIKKHKGSGFMAEALSYGSSDAAGIVRQLIVDDGVPSRPNRKLLFDKRHRMIGIACGGHPQVRSMCAIDLSTFVGLVPVKQVRAPPPEIDIH
jgi:uncharacterized protein YkwD